MVPWIQHFLSSLNHFAPRWIHLFILLCSVSFLRSSFVTLDVASPLVHDDDAELPGDHDISTGDTRVAPNEDPELTARYQRRLADE